MIVHFQQITKCEPLLQTESCSYHWRRGEQGGPLGREVEEPDTRRIFLPHPNYAPDESRDKS